MNKRKKQFIAGAVCPQCSDTDSLVLFTDDQSIACVSCDYEKTSEQRDSEKQNKSKQDKRTAYKSVNSIQITHLDK